MGRSIAPQRVKWPLFFLQTVHQLISRREPIAASSFHNRCSFIIEESDHPAGRPRRLSLVPMLIEDRARRGARKRIFADITYHHTHTQRMRRASARVLVLVVGGGDDVSSSWAVTQHVARINDKLARGTSPSAWKFRRLFCMPKRHPRDCTELFTRARVL